MTLERLSTVLASDLRLLIPTTVIRMPVYQASYHYRRTRLQGS